MTGMMLTQSAVVTPRVSLASLSSISDTQIGSTASASLVLEADGDITQTLSTGSTDLGDWIAPKSAAGANYETQVTVNTGTLSSGTSGSWLSLGSNRTWTVVRSTVGIKTANITVEIRNAASGIVLATATIDLTAEDAT